MSIRLRYVLALFLVASLVTTTVFIVRGLFDEQRADAGVINTAGQQRMLSQRIALLVEKIHSCQDTLGSSQLALDEALNQFHENHVTLTSLPTLPDSVANIYFGESQLDKRVRNYIEQATPVITQQCPNEHRIDIEEASLILSQLNDVVDAFESSARNRVDKVSNIELYLWVATLVLLVMEAIVIFYPMERQIKDTIKKLVATKNEAEASALQARQASKAKSEFLSSMSHELRTPMNGLFGMIELAIDSPEKSTNYLKKAKSAGRQLLVLINDILDFSKIEAGKIRIENSPMDLHQLLDDVVSLQRTYCQNKGITFNYVKEHDFPPIILGDITRISQVLHNLLSNAIKFTERGSVTLTVNTFKKQDESFISFCVEDTGIGIAPEKVSAVFQKFEQADQSTTRLYGGTGLGLSIAKQLALLMQGDISVTSILNHGSKFTFEMPMVPSEFSTAHLHTSKSLNCAIVDDLQTSREYLSHIVTSMGYSATVFSSASAFLNADYDVYDVIILDLAMPEMSGVDLLKVLQERDVTPFPPVILVSAELEQLASDDPVNSLIWRTHTKPLNRNDLELDLQQLGTPDNTPNEKQSGNLYRVLVAEDNEINAEIVKAMLIMEGYKTVHVKDGEQAVNACKKHNFDFILMDCNMPIMDGLTASSILRNDLKIKAPIAALTANAFPEDKKECLDAGMDEFLTKPIDKEVLIQTLKKYLP